MNQPSAPLTAWPLDQPDFVIPADLICVGCGYNLRTLRMGADCPECGQPVRRSARGDELRFANPRWLMGLRIGVMLLIGLIVWDAARELPPSLLNAGLLSYQFYQTLWSMPRWLDILIWLIWLTALIIVYRVDPSTPPDKRPRLNRAALIGTGVFILLLIPSYGPKSIWNWLANQPTLLMVYQVVVTLPTCLLYMLVQAALTIILVRLAKRMRANKLAVWLIVLLAWNLTDKILWLVEVILVNIDFDIRALRKTHSTRG